MIVTATGLELLPLGGIAITIDGDDLRLPERLTYKGMMLGGVPNLALMIGYTNASWTLKCDLTCDYVCRLLNHMRDRGYAYCVPEDGDVTGPSEPLLEPGVGLRARVGGAVPQQGTQRPWRIYQNYMLDVMSAQAGLAGGWGDALRPRGRGGGHRAPEPAAAPRRSAPSQGCPSTASPDGFPRS